MRLLLTLILSFLTASLLAQPSRRKIELQRKAFLSDVTAMTTDSADKVLKIACYLLNSQEFQDSLSKLKFPYANHCIGCGTGKDRNETIPGKIILDSIFRKNKVNLTLRLMQVGKPPIKIFRKKWCWGLGNTCPNTDSITSFYDNIDCDMGEDLPFTYAYAVHVCHEYAHNVGYCHTDHDLDNDVAEAIGWIAFYYIKKWYDDGTIKLQWQ